MTVQELIDKLSQVEDKNMTIFAKIFEEYQDRIVELQEVHEDGMNYVRLF